MKKSSIFVISIFFLFFYTVMAYAEIGDENWDTRFGANGYGFDNEVCAIAKEGNLVYVGGKFIYAGSIFLNHVVYWDGTTFHPLGNGINGNVYALYAIGGTLIAGGDFTMAGGVPARSIALWKNGQWQALGSGLVGKVKSIIVYKNIIYAGGAFTLGNQPCCIARWNGTTWERLAGGDPYLKLPDAYAVVTGVEDYPVINAMHIHNDLLVVAGLFNALNGLPDFSCKNIAMYDGNTWYGNGQGYGEYITKPIPPGPYYYYIPSVIYALGGNLQTLYAGGNIINDQPLAKFNGTSWQAAGLTRMWEGTFISAIASDYTNIYLSGLVDWTMPGYEIEDPYVVKQTANGWENLGSGLDQVATAILATNDEAYFGGKFTSAGGKDSRRFAIWHNPPATEGWTFLLNVPVAPSGSLVFGRHPNGTIGYDPDLDELVPPPPIGSDYAYFRAEGNLTLRTDIRAMEESFDDEQNELDHWEMMLQKNILPQASPTIIWWNPELLPKNRGRFTLQVNNGPIIDMAECSSVSVSSSAIITIRQIPLKTTEFLFPRTGWYLISLPVVPLNNQVSALFPDAWGGVAYSYNPQNGNYIECTTINPGIGYWLAIMRPCHYFIEGYNLPDLSLSLARGWNLIGVPNNYFSDEYITDTPAGSIIRTYYYWDYADSVYLPSDQLMPNLGFWVFALRECTLQIGPIESSPKVQTGAQGSTSLQHTPPPPPFLTTKVKQVADSPSTHAIFQSYPNPFNAQCTIRYTLDKPTDVEVSVWNLRGERIRTLVDAKQNQGAYRILWDGKDSMGNHLASGIYLIRLSTPEKIQTIRTVFMK